MLTIIESIISVYKHYIYFIYIQNKTTALIYASEYGHLPVVKYLVNKGAAINAQDNVRNHIIYRL